MRHFELVFLYVSVYVCVFGAVVVLFLCLSSKRVMRVKGECKGERKCVIVTVP